MPQNQYIQEIQAQASNFVCKEVGTDTLLVPLRDNVADFNQYLTLNELGSFIFQLITKNNDFDAIQAAILATYDVSAEQAAQDLSQFIEQLYHFTIGHA
ncbi:MAG: PqqD family protein [Flavobacteriales bacterium]